ncbi:MAG: amidohydrolase [Myxococcales bacterium]|nr:amidohydrolase [Myxococcales bacterium]
MPKSRFPWLSLRKKTDPEFPVEPPMWMGSRSNGEYFHQQTSRERLIRKLVLERADESSRKLGMDRREFLASSMGMFTTLAVINQVGGCGGDDGDGTTSTSVADAAMGSAPDAGAMVDAAAADAASGATGKGNAIGSCPYVVPTEATCEETDLLSGDEFIFDVQTHSFDDGEWRQRNNVYASFLGILATCTDASERLACFDEQHYGTLMFVESDTTVSVISSWPAQLCSEGGPSVCGLPLSNPAMRELRDSINRRAKSERVVNQVQVMANDRWELQAEAMTMAAQDPAWGAVAWKGYPGWGPADAGIGGAGYFLNDDTGRTFIEHGLSLGVSNFAIHKGLPIPGFDVEHNQPVEVGATAKEYPEATFIIYHSGIGAGTGNILSVATPERVPFDENIEDPLQHQGVNQLIASMRQAGLGAGDNVYAEMGSAWSNVMDDPVAAQHYIGKLLKYFGEDNIVWGTDSILYGSPQPQIDAFRRFQITEEFQEMYGYPQLTEQARRKIFGLNAAAIYCVDPDAKRCAVTADEFASVRQHWDADFGPRRWAIQEPLGPTSRREFLQLARFNRARRQPG